MLPLTRIGITDGFFKGFDANELALLLGTYFNLQEAITRPDNSIWRKSTHENKYPKLEK